MRCGSLDYFFFSSRRRHTRLQGDWSSDVCSSDLHEVALENLVTKSAVLQAQAVPDDHGNVNLVLIQTLDGYDASRILLPDRKSTRLNSSRLVISYAVFCLKKKKLQIVCRDDLLHA